MQSDRDYFALRAAEERAAAKWASHENVRLRHEQLAGRYEELAHAISQREYALGLDLYQQ